MKEWHHSLSHNLYLPQGKSDVNWHFEPKNRDQKLNRWIYEAYQPDFWLQLLNKQEPNKQQTNKNKQDTQTTKTPKV